jgi:hypothetical protein
MSQPAQEVPEDPPPEPPTQDPDHRIVVCHACEYMGTILDVRGFCGLCYNPYCNDCSWYDEDGDQIYCYACIREHDIILTDSDDSEPPDPSQKP